ncbi:MAG: glycosyltransferase [Lachnospiraceae bacterium]|nr:glycosyltransferase [Lachnospiraceae bacterium]
MFSLKKSLKQKTNSGKISRTQVINEVQPYLNVSFDLFDTILKRNVQNPTDVFRLIEMKLNNKYIGFKDKRIDAERKARKLKKREEVTLYDIYKQYSDITKEQINDLIKIEMETEMSILTVNKDIFAVYQKCLEMNKNIYFVSDMYLTQTFLKEVLFVLNIRGYKKIYVSSEYGETKRSGGLFQILLKEQKIRADELIHIGDSVYADYKIPKSLGIKSIHIPQFVEQRLFRKQGNEKRIHINYLNTFLNNSVPALENKYYRFGYERFGMFLWGYVKWLYNSIKEKDIHKIYFLSRDGFVMKKAFDIVNQDPGVRTYYLEVSRRSLRIPILWMDSSFSTLLDMLTPSKMIPLTAIFDGVGLDINKYEKIIRSYGLEKNCIFSRNEILRDQKLLCLYNELIPDIIKTSKKEYEILKEYILQNQLEGKFAIVDIGWSGGMQCYLKKTLDKLQIKNQISGYYIGVAPYYIRNQKKDSSLDLNGYLFDFSRNSNEKDKRSCFVGLFETLFLEQDGSVKNYSRSITDNRVIANRYPYEYIRNGKTTEELIKVQEIQKGAVDFINCASQDDQLNEFVFTADELFMGLKKTGTEPNKLDMNLFADFRFFDEGETTKLADPKSVFWYIFRLNELRKDFYKSCWKIGFMKKMLKFPLKYEYIYNALKKIE